MIPITSTQATTSNLNNRIACTIHQSPYLFETLANMYKAPIEACTREYACNAYDAHVAANTPDQPITIKLPTYLDPVIEFSDQGPGMSPEFVAENFSAYGFSGKTTTNDQIGSFGLGSKSAFSVTDSFTLTSIYQGTKYIWAIYKDTVKDVSGVEFYQPVVSLMDSAATDQPNGVTVSIPVNPNAVEKWRYAVENELRFFPVLPIILQGTAINPVKYSYQSNYVSFTTYSLDYPYLLVGPVGYKLNTDRLSSEFRAKYPVFKSRRLVVHTNIGEIKVTPSREDLVYDELAMEKLEALAIKITQNLRDIVTASVKAAETRHEKIQLLYQAVYEWRLTEFYPEFTALRDFNIKDSMSIAHGEISHRYISKTQRHKSSLSAQPSENIDLFTMGRNSQIVFIKRGKKGPSATKVEKVLDHNFSGYGIQKPTAYVFYSEDDPVALELIKVFPESKILHFDTLPLPPTVRQTGTRKEIAKYLHITDLIYTDYKYFSLVEPRFDGEISLSYGTKPFLWAPLWSNKFSKEDGALLRAANKVSVLANSLRKYTLVGIPAAHRHTWKDQPMPKITDHIRTFVTNLANDSEVAENIRLYNAHNYRHDLEASRPFTLFINHTTSRDWVVANYPNSLLAKIIKTLMTDDYAAINAVLEQLDTPELSKSFQPTDEDIKAVDNLFEQYKSTYPLFEDLLKYSSLDLSRFGAYLTLVNK